MFQLLLSRWIIWWLVLPWRVGHGVLLCRLKYDHTQHLSPMAVFPEGQLCPLWCYWLQYLPATQPMLLLPSLITRVLLHPLPVPGVFIAMHSWYLGMISNYKDNGRSVCQSLWKCANCPVSSSGRATCYYISIPNSQLRDDTNVGEWGVCEWSIKAHQHPSESRRRSWAASAGTTAR